MNAPFLLEGRALQKAFGPTPALRGLDISVGAGEVLAVMGPSGSGKSTLLHCLAGILTPDAGEVRFDGHRIDNLGERQRTKLRRSAFGVPLSLALWDGYPAARERLYAAARRAGSQLLTLSGDSHTFMVNRLIAADGSRMGVEIGTSAVSSPSVFAQVPDFGVDLTEHIQFVIDAMKEVADELGLRQGLSEGGSKEE